MLNGPILPGFGGDSITTPISASNHPVPPVSTPFPSLPISTSSIPSVSGAPSLGPDLPLCSPQLSTDATAKPLIPAPSVPILPSSSVPIKISALTLAHPSLPPPKPCEKPIKMNLTPSTSPIASAGLDPTTGTLIEGSRTTVINPKTVSANNAGDEVTNDTQLTRSQKAAMMKALRKAKRDAEKEPEEDIGTRKKQKENPLTLDTAGECHSGRKVVALTPCDADASPMKLKKRAVHRK